jgi:hypothetical protein
VNFSVDVVERTFYDSAGEPIRIQVHEHGEGQLVNTVTGATNTGSSPTGAGPAPAAATPPRTPGL